MQFNDFIDSLINNNGINDLDKKELKNEIYDHLLMLKNEYIEKGKSEEESIKLSIEKFGQSNYWCNEMKSNLPSRNKFKILPLGEYIKCITLMFFLFLSITLISSYNSWGNDRIPLMVNSFLAFIIIFTSLTFVTIKLFDINNFNKTLITINILYFLFEKVSVFILNIIFIVISGDVTKGIFHSKIFLYKYAFSCSYIVSYILIFIVFLLLGKYFFVRFNDKFINKFNSKIIYIILFIVSIVFTIIHFMIITSPYFFYRILNLLSINYVDSIHYNTGNIFYISFNDILFPNIGFVSMSILLIIFLFDLGCKQINRKYQNNF